MGQMMQIDQVVNLIEVYVKQLEGLAYSKNAAMGIRLQGAIDNAVQIAGVSADQWSGRVQRALLAIMADKPAASTLPADLPAGLASAVTLPTPQQAAQSGNVVPLPRV